jgi:hypothetical protein
LHQQQPYSWHSRAGGGAVHSINSGHMHRSKLHLYSITSFARSKTVPGSSNLAP